MIAKIFKRFFGSKASPESEVHSAGFQSTIQSGDILLQENDLTWQTVRILALDEVRVGLTVAHCMVYQKFESRPEIGELTDNRVMIWHMPIDGTSFIDGWETIGNEPIQEAQLIGYIEYLRHTDFPRYCELTGEDMDTRIKKSVEHFERATALSDEKKFQEAAVEYGKSVDAFPLYFEAADNQGLTLMDAGLYEDAIASFDRSLGINPDGVDAFFSKGECLMRLQRFDDAEAIFSEGAQRFRRKRALFKKYLKHTRELRGDHA